MSYAQSWRTLMLKQLKDQAATEQNAALGQYNQLYGGGTTQSGALNSATNAIAANEAVNASGVNQIAAEQMRAEEEQRRQYEQARKDQQSAARWGAVGNLVAAVAPGIIGKLFPVKDPQQDPQNKLISTLNAGGWGGQGTGPGPGSSFVSEPQRQMQQMQQMQPPGDPTVNPLQEWIMKARMSRKKRQQYPGFNDSNFYAPKFDTSRLP